ncbi:MAG: OmpA family protein, partial [Bacteroidales bacterium]|nr:OmpA family protein [Bacteroidales bacterium]
NKPKYKNHEEYKNRRVDIEIYKIEIPIIEKKEVIVAKKSTPLAEKAERNATQKAETLLQAEVGETISFEDIQFHPGTPTPLQSSIPALKALANILLEYANLEIEIQGHICCALVDDADISTKRSLTVYNFLIESGIEASRLKYKGYGRSRPKTQERTPEEKQMNRRVEIKILKK